MGILYGISTGPGDPELLTLKAVRILSACNVITCPQTKSGTSLARQIVQGAVDLSGKQIVPMQFPMSEDRQVLRENYEHVADLLCEHLLTEDVAMLCLGDLSLYATFTEVAVHVAERGFGVERIPGVPSFCAVAARAGMPLASAGEPLQILPYGCEEFAERIYQPGAKVILKCGGHMTELVQFLQITGLLERAYAVENCGLEGERYVPVLSVPEEQWSYFTVVCIPAENPYV